MGAGFGRAVGVPFGVVGRVGVRRAPPRPPGVVLKALLDAAQRVHRDQHRVVAHQRHRVEGFDVADVHAAQIARGQVEVAGDFRRDQQQLAGRQGERAELFVEGFGLGSVEGECGGRDGLEAVLADEFGENTAHRAPIHLAVQLHGMIARTRREGAPAAAPQRAANGTRPRPSGALLAPRLAPAAARIGARLLRLAALPRAGQIGHHRLMHERLVEGAAEDAVRDFDARLRVRAGRRQGD